MHVHVYRLWKQLYPVPINQLRSDQTRHSAGGHHSKRRMEAHSSDSTCGECTCVHLYILYYLCWMRCTRTCTCVHGFDHIFLWIMHPNDVCCNVCVVCGSSLYGIMVRGVFVESMWVVCSPCTCRWPRDMLITTSQAGGYQDASYLLSLSLPLLARVNRSLPLSIKSDW